MPSLSEGNCPCRHRVLAFCVHTYPLSPTCPTLLHPCVCSPKEICSVKFQMAPNSLFAILLRSRWWISCLIAAVWALAAAALVPQPYKLVGILGSLPFWALGLVACLRQIGGLSEDQETALLQDAAGLSWPAFAERLQRAWVTEGYDVQRLPDGPADFRLSRQGYSMLVMAKRWKASVHGVEPLRELLTAQTASGADSSAYISLGELPEPTQRFADGQGMVTVHGSALANLLHKAR